MNKRLNFGGDPDHCLDAGLFSGFVTIGRYRKWLTAAHTVSLDGGTGKTCIGEGIHCPSASNLTVKY